MKKFFLIAAVAGAALVSSCGFQKGMSYTATSVGVGTSVQSQNIADLDVSERVTYRYTTTSDDRAYGLSNCKAAAIAAMLKNNGNADVIVAPEYKYDSKLNFIEVTGRPAKYKNFRSSK